MSKIWLRTKKKPAVPASKFKLMLLNACRHLPLTHSYFCFPNGISVSQSAFTKQDDVGGVYVHIGRPGSSGE